MKRTRDKRKKSIITIHKEKKLKKKKPLREKEYIRLEENKGNLLFFDKSRKANAVKNSLLHCF